MCHISFVRCQVMRVTRHLSHFTNANSHSHRPSPCYLPHYAQQDGSLRPINQLFPLSNFRPFLSQKLNVFKPLPFHNFNLRILFVINNFDQGPRSKKTFKNIHNMVRHCTDIASYRLNRPRGQFSEYCILLFFLFFFKEISL